MRASDLAMSCFYFGMTQSMFLLAALTLFDNLRFGEAMILNFLAGVTLAFLLYLKEKLSKRRSENERD